MNKQELIESISHLPSDCSRPRPMIDKLTALELIELLDEPQKVTVPQFVADWYEEHKDDFETELFQCIYKMPNIFEMNKLSKFEEWLIDEHTKPFQTLVNMHQFGYEVEKEKKYTVKVKGNLGQYLGKYYLNNVELTPQFIRVQNSEPSIFTKEELEQTGFGWVFDCEGIEIEEVKG